MQTSLDYVGYVHNDGRTPREVLYSAIIRTCLTFSRTIVELKGSLNVQSHSVTAFVHVVANRRMTG